MKKFTAQDMLDLFGVRLTPNRQKCCLLSWRVLQAAIYSPVARQRRGPADAGGGNAHDAPLPTSTSRFDPQRFRPDFPILARTVHGGVPLVYLDNAATSQRPRQVIEAIVDAYEHHYANVHRGIHALSEEIDELYEDAREKVRAFINAPSEPPEGDSPATTEQVIFTSGTTHSINLVARSWGDANVRAGDEILLTEMEHHSNLVPWYQLAERTGAVVRHIPLDRRRPAAARRPGRAADQADEAGLGDGRLQRAGHDQPDRRNHPPCARRRARWCWSTGRRACRT